MPRTVHPDLKDCLERPNPFVEYRIEISEPDVGQVLRRQDQFTTAPSLVSLSPALSLTASARGSLILAPSTVALASFTGTGSYFNLDATDNGTRFKGIQWSLDQAFSRVTLKTIAAQVQAVSIAGFFFEQTFECQIFQLTYTPGVKVANAGTPQYTATVFTDYAFAPLLNPAPTVTVTGAQWVASNIQTLPFDFSNFRLVLENNAGNIVSPDQTGTLAQYLIVVRLVGKGIGSNANYRWLLDTATSHSVSGVGTFDRVFWGRADQNSQWIATTTTTDVPNAVISIETYPASGQGIYKIDQGALPKATSSGRIEFERALPAGTAATVELSTAGSGGPWTPVKHGDPVSIVQQVYHLRTTLTSDASQRATPEVIAQGVEFRTPQDVSIEGIPTMPTRR